MRRPLAAVALLTLLAILGRAAPVAAQGRGLPVSCVVTISTAVILRTPLSWARGWGCICAAPRANPR